MAKEEGEGDGKGGRGRGKEGGLEGGREGGRGVEGSFWAGVGGVLLPASTSCSSRPHREAPFLPPARGEDALNSTRLIKRETKSWIFGHIVAKFSGAADSYWPPVA